MLGGGCPVQSLKKLGALKGHLIVYFTTLLPHARSYGANNSFRNLIGCGFSVV
jgi:hypothetical protein